MLIFQKVEMKLKRMVIKRRTMKIQMTPGIKILLEVEIVKFILTPITKQLMAIVIKKKLPKLLMVR